MFVVSSGQQSANKTKQNVVPLLPIFSKEGLMENKERYRPARIDIKEREKEKSKKKTASQTR